MGSKLNFFLILFSFNLFIPKGYNEPSVGDLNSMRWYNQFEVARVNLLASKGKKSAIGCFAVGNPDVTTPAKIEAF